MRRRSITYRANHVTTIQTSAHILQGKGLLQIRPQLQHHLRVHVCSHQSITDFLEKIINHLHKRSIRSHRRLENGEENRSDSDATKEPFLRKREARNWRQYDEDCIYNEE